METKPSPKTSTSEWDSHVQALHAWHIANIENITDQFLSEQKTDLFFSCSLGQVVLSIVTINKQRVETLFFKALHFIGNSMNKMIYHVRIHSYLFLFWAILQVCSINLKVSLLSSSHIQNPASWTQDWRQAAGPEQWSGGLDPEMGGSFRRRTEKQ